jgi:hypothetical protein
MEVGNGQAISREFLSQSFATNQDATSNFKIHRYMGMGRVPAKGGFKQPLESKL